MPLSIRIPAGLFLIGGSVYLSIESGGLWERNKPGRKTQWMILQRN